MAGAGVSQTQARTVVQGGATSRQLAAWASYDWASSPFFAVIITFVFAAYFTQGVAPDEVVGTAQWGWAMTVSALLIAAASPVLGAVADVGGRRKPWLLVFTLVSAATTWALWTVEPEPSFMLRCLVLVVLANTALEIGQAFYNAMLPDLARPAEVGRWSGWGWGLGYAAGIVVLLLLLKAVIEPTPPPFGLDESRAEDVRIVGPIVAIWMVLFAIPLFLLTPDKPRGHLPTGAAVRQGLAVLIATFRDLPRHRDIALFLLARLVYNDGLNTLFAFGGIYAAGTFGMTTPEIIMFGVALNVTAGLGAFAFAFMDDRLGSKPTILVALVGLFVSGTVALLATERATFWVAALFIGIFVGPAQSASRTLMARLAPPERRTEMFGLFALTGKVTAFIGPFLFGTATYLAGTQRAGMATILVMFVIGGLLLTRVREPRRGLA
jgi:UMF1 family MFS transporter